MSIGTAGFVGARLRQAREARGLTLVALADLVEVSAAAISQYEKGEHTPRSETLAKLSLHLNVPIDNFLNTRIVGPNSNVFYRSMSAATKQARSRAERRYEWFKEIVEYLSSYLDFPEANIPSFDLPRDFREITTLQIESLAEQTRDIWRLGRGPITNLTRTLESNGIFVTLSSIGSEHLDAFSEYDRERDRPFVFLGDDKANMVRTRFDGAHELFHLIAHRSVDKNSLSKPSDFKLLEKQAHQFASAFLMPATTFSEELWDVSLDSFRSMKSRWKTSIASMIFRAEELNLVGEAGAKRLRINLSRRGWRRREPLDDLAVETPSMISRAFEILIENDVAGRTQILEELALPAKDIENLANLPVGFFSATERDAGPKLKPSNVVDFRR